MLNQPWEGGEDTTKKDARQHREDLFALIKQHGGEVLPYPEVDHKRLVVRAVDKRKPFSESGAGYRDALIWETVRGQTLLGNERVVFVSNNTNSPWKPNSR